MNLDSDKELTGRLDGQKGSIMIEFVFCISILVCIFMATVTFSFLFADYYSTQKVAREGAKEASITLNTETAREKAIDAAWLWGLELDRTGISFSTDSTTVTCTVNYAARPFNRTFPKLFEGTPLNEEYHFKTEATFPWSIVR